jgi:hypothetical protein
MYNNLKYDALSGAMGLPSVRSWSRRAILFRFGIASAVPREVIHLSPYSGKHHDQSRKNG